MPDLKLLGTLSFLFFIPKVVRSKAIGNIIFFISYSKSCWVWYDGQTQGYWVRLAAGPKCLGFGMPTDPFLKKIIKIIKKNLIRIFVYDTSSVV
jgi:hypothetical protein